MPAPKPGAFDPSALRRLREGAGLTKSALAEKVGVTPRTLGKWEDGLSLPAPKWVLALAEALEVDEARLRLPSDLPTTLRALRARAGLGQRDLAQKLSAPQSTLSQWEQGKIPLPERFAPLYAEALGLTAAEVTEAARASVSAAAANTGPPAVDLVLVYPRSVDGATVVGEGDPPTRAYTPQGHEIELIAEDWTGELGRSPWLKGLLAGVALVGGTVRVHNEVQTTEEGSPSYALRWQTTPPSDARRAAFQWLRIVLSRAMFKPGTLDDPEGDAATRERLFSLFPEGYDGDRVFIASLPSDDWGWLRDQCRPGVVHAAVFHDPNTREVVVGEDGEPGRGSTDLVIAWDTNLHELADELDKA